MTLQSILVTALVMFTAGLTGAVVRQKLSVALISIWMMFLSAAMSAVAFARWNLLPDGKIIAILIVGVGVIIVSSGFVFQLLRDDDGNKYGLEEQENLKC